MAATNEGPPGSKDALFAAPYVDVDEGRDEPVPHRYVHGGFDGTETRFSFYLPPVERYEGRFFHPLMAWSGTETAAAAGGVVSAAGSVDFAFASGAYLVESNQGRTTPTIDPDDPTIHGYRASAAAARYSRVVAAAMYGAHRPYGYVYGGSGGGFRTISCFENCWDVWDGAVPFIHPHPASLPNHMSALAHALRLLRDKMPTIVDAVEPGGSGDMFAGLNVEEREALATVTRLGFPPRIWFDFEHIARNYTGVWAVFADQMLAADPEYFEDFWTVPGYLGADAPDSLVRARVEHKTTVRGVVMPDDAAARSLPTTLAMRVGAGMVDRPVALRIGGLPDTHLLGATLEVTSGRASGRRLYIVDVVGDLVLTGDSGTQHAGLIGIEAGDEVVIDNSAYLAFQTYTRHQVDARFPEWDQFCVAGQPVYPQRPTVLGDRIARGAAGSNYTGRFAGKMIVVQNLLDEGAFPSNAVYYRRLVEAALGPQLDDRYRLWFNDHALHLPIPPSVRPGEAPPVKTTRVIDYIGTLQQALRDLSAWVESGVAPPASTGFEYVDGQVRVPPTAAARKGIQPVVTLTANGRTRAEVAAGEPVEFSALVEVPPAAGTVVAGAWDFEGRGDYPLAESGVDGSSSRVTLTATYTFIEPGTYFPALRVTSQRQGDVATPYARIHNLGRARVVVG